MSLFFASFLTLSLGQAQAETPVERGARLYRTAGCVGCHSPPGEDSVHLAGGRDNPTLFGTFYAPNISAHATDGLGDWTERDFFRAMRKGRNPKGKSYWPTFAFMAFTKMSDRDIHALWAYLRAEPPVEGTVPEHDPKYPKFLLSFWRSTSFEMGAMEYDHSQSDPWNQGRYLVQAVGYCDQCHTPRRKTGLLINRKYMAGGANPGKSEIHPNLTPDPDYGIGDWSEDDIVQFLSDGTRPNGSTTRSDWVMLEKIEDSYQYFTDQEKRSIAVYLKSLKPIAFDPETFYEGW